MSDINDRTAVLRAWRECRIGLDARANEVRMAMTRMPAHIEYTSAMAKAALSTLREHAERYNDENEDEGDDRFEVAINTMMSPLDEHVLAMFVEGAVDLNNLMYELNSIRKETEGFAKPFSATDPNAGLDAVVSLPEEELDAVVRRHRKNCTKLLESLREIHTDATRLAKIQARRNTHGLPLLSTLQEKNPVLFSENVLAPHLGRKTAGEMVAFIEGLKVASASHGEEPAPLDYRGSHVTNRLQLRYDADDSVVQPSNMTAFLPKLRMF